MEKNSCHKEDAEQMAIAEEMRNVASIIYDLREKLALLEEDFRKKNKGLIDDIARYSARFTALRLKKLGFAG